MGVGKNAGDQCEGFSVGSRPASIGTLSLVAGTGGSWNGFDPMDPPDPL